MKWMIPLVLLAVAAAPATGPSTRPAGKWNDLTVEQFDAARSDKKLDAVVLDVRTKAEHDAGHIPGSILLDVRDPDFEKKLAALDPKRAYLVHCATGRRSVTACKVMESKGFEKLHNLLGGMRAWEAAGKPVER